jgi:hypothetical protein
VKKLPLFTPRQALFYHQRPLDSQDDDHRARVFWASALSIPCRPPRLCPDPASTAVGQQRNDACTLATGGHMLDTGPRTFHRHVSTSPRHPGDGRPLPGHVATAASAASAEPSLLRHRLRVSGTPRPPLDPIKERAEGSQRETNVFSPLQRSTSQATRHFSFCGDLGPVSSLTACNPYASTSVQGNTILSPRWT